MRFPTGPVIGMLGALIVLAGCDSSGGGNFPAPPAPVTAQTAAQPESTPTSGQSSVPPAPSGGDADALYGTYHGTMSLTVSPLPHCPNGDPQAETFTQAATLNLGAPPAGESNPFWFSFVGGSNQTTGSLLLYSDGQSLASGTDLGGNPRDPRLAYPYWSVHDASGHVDGSMVYDGRDLGAIANGLILDRSLIDCPGGVPGDGGALSEATAIGATLFGTIGGGHAQLSFTGKTYDTWYQFTATFTA